MLNNVLIGLGLLLSVVAHSQNGSSETIQQYLDSAKFYQAINFDSAIRWSEKAEATIHSSGVNGHAHHLIRAYRIKVLASRYFSRLQQCLQYIDTAKAIIDQLKTQLGPDYELSRIENELSRGMLFRDMDDFAKSLSIFTESLQGLKELPQSTKICGDLFSAAQYVAGIHTVRGEFEASINQYLASISYYECYETNDDRAYYYALTFRNIGQTYLGKGDNLRAKEYLDKAEDSLRFSLLKSPDQYATLAITLYEALASYYRAVGKNDSARLAVQKAVPLLRYSEPFGGRVYLGLGEAYEGIGKFNLAKEYYEKAQAFFLKSSGAKNISLSKTYLAIGRLYEKQSRFDKALEYFQKAIGSLVLNFEPGIRNNPALTNILSKKQLFISLQMKSRLLEKLSLADNDTVFLQHARQTNRLALALLDSTANEFSLNADKVILVEQSFGAFEEGIRIAFRLYSAGKDERYFDDCFLFADKSKGIVLLENLRLVNRYARVDPPLIDQEKAIRSELLQTEQALYQEEMKGGTTGELFSIRERYATIKRDYNAWIDKIKKEAPAYYQLRFDHQSISTEQIQQSLLKDGEALIEYFVGDSALTVFGFSRNHKYLAHKKIPPDFLDRVSHLRDLLTSADYTRPKRDFEETSGYFYDLLLKDCLQEFGAGITSLTVIPDGILGYVPFEILVNSTEKNPHYLINDFSIRYAYSASYLSEQLQKKSSGAKYFFAGFVSAGDEQTATQTTPGFLAGAKTEITSIVKLLSGSFSIYEPATKQDFLDHASNFKVLHLAMHSLVNDLNPMLSELVFSNNPDTTAGDNRLTAIELYNMQLKADMVVLSACNTGFGQMHRGEGIMSLSRAFAYAGVPSALISLWQVPDKATSKIMVNYYQHLSKGLPKDRALLLAKEDFIRDYPQMAEPYYWSGFILTGNSGPVQFPKSNAWLWLGVCFLILLMIWVTGRNRIRKKNSKSYSNSMTS